MNGGSTGFDPEAFFELARKHGHGRALGLEYRASGPDWAELALPWREELVGVPESGILASGAIVSLIDTASGTATWISINRLVPILTLNLRIDYLRPAVKGETIIARAECVKLTKRIAFVRAIAHGGDIDRPMATSAATFMIHR